MNLLLLIIIKNVLISDKIQQLNRINSIGTKKTGIIIVSSVSETNRTDRHRKNVY